MKTLGPYENCRPLSETHSDTSVDGTFGLCGRGECGTSQRITSGETRVAADVTHVDAPPTKLPSDSSLALESRKSAIASPKSASTCSSVRPFLLSLPLNFRLSTLRMNPFLSLPDFLESSTSTSALSPSCSNMSTWGICPRRAGKLYKARSRLYRSQSLQVNTRWKALAEIYTMHSFAPLSNLKIFVKNC